MVDLAIALHEHGDLTRAKTVIEVVVDRAKGRDDPRILARALLQRSELQLYTGSAAHLHLEPAREAVRILEAAGDELGLARAWMLLGDLDVHACQFGAATSCAERAVRHAHRAGARREEERSLVIMASRYAIGPAPVAEAIIRCEKLLAEAARRPRAQALIRADALSMLHAMQGRLELARTLYSHGRATAEDLGLPGEAAGVTHAGGFIEMLAGDPIAAERELRRGYETLERMGEKATLSTSAGLLAQALAAQGRAGEAERFLQIADETASQDDVASQGLIRAVRARLLARRGEFAEAERLAQEALALDAPTDDYLEHHDVRVTAVEVRLAAGDRRGAASMLEELLALEVAKGNVVSADHARKQLAELAEENASS